MIQTPPGTPQKIEICGVELTEFRSLDQAIENFKIWISLGLPDRKANRLWTYIPLLKDAPCGTVNSIDCHEIEIKLLIGDADYRWSHLFPRSDLRNATPIVAAKMLLARLEATDWETGYFDSIGSKIA